jgi:hypothetical protein
MRKKIMALDTEEEKFDENGKITQQHAESVAEKVKQQHPVFSYIKVVDGGTRWNFEYAASPKNIKVGKKEKKEKGVLRIEPYPIKPKFTVYANNPSHFNKQLDRQIEGINKMVVKDWKKNREEFRDNGRKKGDLDLIRERIRRDIADAYIKKNLAKFENKLDDEIRKIGEEYAKTILTKNDAILHEPDQVAGGQVFLNTLYKNGDITNKTELDASNLIGDRGANSSIGSQWGYNKHERAEGILIHVEKEIKGDKEKENYLMNVKL